MTSLPARFSFGDSASGVVDALASYRRAQYYLSDSVSQSGLTDDENEDDGCYSIADEEYDTGYDGIPHIAPTGANYPTDDLPWDEDLTPRAIPTTRTYFAPAHTRQSSRETIVPASVAPVTHERTPLLRRTTSLTYVPNRRTGDISIGAKPDVPQRQLPSAILRRASTMSVRSKASIATRNQAKHATSGQSTFGQTLFNAIAILLGVGMLSEPLAFSYAGWFGGTCLIIFCGFITCYTAKILAHNIFADSSLKSYADIGRKAFGPRSGPFISVLFCLELFTVCVALVTLFADSLHSIMPAYSVDLYKILGLVILLPTMLMPLSVLAYASFLGIVSTLLIVAVIFIDGFSKTEGPGSLWSPEPTDWGVSNMGQLGVSFGLFMAGFSGHAVIPSLAKDMADPSEFDTMIDYAFMVATVLYSVIGVAGYLMFGNAVSDEFSKDLMQTSGYNPLLNKVALWGLVLAPLSKYALAARPVIITLEMWLGIETTPQVSDDHGASAKPLSAEEEPRPILKSFLAGINRTIFTVLSVVVSILVPEFGSVMAFLGSFSAFLLCVIGPLAAKVALVGRCSMRDGVLLAIAITMAVWGTGAAFWDPTD